MSKILLIDDETDILRVLSLSLKADGHEVLTATEGQQGLAIFEEEKPDIILTDVKMPGMDGIDVLRAIKQHGDESEVIIVTGHGDIDTAIEALQLGASDFINKPVRDKALAVSLKRARERLEVKRQLKEYTLDLETKVDVATRELRRQSSFQIKLIRSSNDGIVATNQDLRIVIFNPGAEKIFGYPQQEVINRMGLPDLMTPELAEGFQRAMAADKSVREFPWRETLIVSQQGEQIPVRFSGTILTEKSRKMGAVAFFQDLREIKRLQQELVQSERLAAIGQTVAGLAHGIKNILHGLKGGSYLVDIGLKRNDTAKLKSGWQSIKRNIDRTSELVMDLLTFAKERVPEYENCFPNEIAADVAHLLKQLADDNGIELVLDFDSTISEVSMDPRTVHRVLLNLMSNAIDACLFDENTDKKFRVGLRTTGENGSWIRFDVTDNGVGMSEEVQSKLFSSFFSTKGHRGTGLGLMNTRKMIEEHLGTIAVTSEPAAGTVFTVRLPFRAAKTAEPGG
ncbi:MAG: histidine kinase [Deltaproteobacteria bacterium SG8_13]|nr:MAG: histidine kinase [Deltaproteobacteria bacterium SG8_13]